MRRTNLPLRTIPLAFTLAAVACGDGSPENETSTTAESTTSTAGPEETGGDTEVATSSEGDEDTGSSASSGATADSSGAAGTSDESDSTGEDVCDATSFELPGDAFYPEGIAAHEGALYVGSMATGEVVRIADCGDTVDSFVAPADLVRNAIGLRVDGPRDLLWVCNSDIAFATPPSVDAFELATGDRVATHPFDAAGFCNDIALDDDGNVYATDSAGHRLHRIAANDALADTVTETWFADPSFVVGQGEFGLNGIAYDPAGALWFSNYQLGELYHLEVNDDGSPGLFTIREVDAGLPLPDGVLWDDGDLLVVSGGASVVRLQLTDPVALTEVGGGLDFGTTVAVSDGAAWVPEGQLDHLFGLDPTPPSLPFVVQRVAL